MKTLLLLRHAKSSWEDAGLADHDRPLAPRGQRAAQRIARHLAEQRVQPEMVLCSSARRARETLALIAPELGPAAAVLVEEELYGASAEDLLGRLRRVDEPTVSVMLIGHNPGIQDLAVSLTGRGPDAERLRDRFPTAALATLRVHVGSWGELRRGRAELDAYVVPREL